MDGRLVTIGRSGAEVHACAAMSCYEQIFEINIPGRLESAGNAPADTVLPVFKSLRQGRSAPSGQKKEMTG